MSKDRMELWLEGERELFANMQKKIGGLGKAGRQALQKGGMIIVNDAKVNLRNNRSVATGMLRASGKVQKVQGDEDAVDAGFFSEGQGYAAFVEYGTRAGGRRTIRFLLPLIKQWMRKKGIGGNGADFNHRAFFITRKIVRKGTRPHPFFGPAVDKNKKAVVDSIAEAIDKETK